MRRPPDCNCNQPHEVNAHRGCVPVALWTCPVHANVFEEKTSYITLTSFQEEVLATVKREYDAGRDATVDAVSRILNRTTASVDRAMAVLRSIGFIAAT